MRTSAIVPVHDQLTTVSGTSTVLDFKYKDPHRLLVIETKYGKGEDTLSKVEETVQEDQLKVDAAPVFHDQRPDTEGDS